MINWFYRITSYNVCYTKLLRSAFLPFVPGSYVGKGVKGAVKVAGKVDDITDIGKLLSKGVTKIDDVLDVGKALGKADDLLEAGQKMSRMDGVLDAKQALVITSYSIHYTKLYELPPV